MRWTRRKFLGTTTAGSVAAFQNRRPNILVFMSDQESALLPGPVRLPNRERLRKRGTTYTHAFCNTPQCSPARAALLTGLYPHKAGVLTNVDRTSLGKALPPETPTVGSVFAGNGYRTGYFGKWHLGNEDAGLNAYGFAESSLSSNDEKTVADAATWIKKQSEPWLAWVSVLDPHHIYDAPKLEAKVTLREGVRRPVSDLGDLVGKPSEQMWFVEKNDGRPARNFSSGQWLSYRSYYLDLVETVDRHLGTVLSAVKEWDNTVVVYTSDHGDALGEHGLAFKGPFMYEELIRIPLIVSRPGTASESSAALTTQADLMPMLTDLAGLKPPAGRADRPESRDAVFLEYYAKQKYVNPIRTVRTLRWKLNWYDSGQKELYDLQADPHEILNLAGETQTAAVQSDLEKRLSAWRQPLTRP